MIILPLILDLELRCFCMIKSNINEILFYSVFNNLYMEIINRNYKIKNINL